VAHVERPFHFIYHNYLAGHRFSSWYELNLQARQWCDRVNATYKKHIRAVPRELFAVERPQLKPLPTWIPEVYRLHQRMVDVEGYVALHTNRYSVPLEWIGRRVEVRDQRQDRDSTRCPQAGHSRPHCRGGASEDTSATTPSTARAGHGADTAPSRRASHSNGGPEITDYVARMILRRVAREYFLLDDGKEPHDD